MNFIIGLLVGWLTLYLAAITLKYLKQKKGVRSKEYDDLKFTMTLRDTIRHIVFEYDIKRKNNDFLLKIKLNERQIMQLMHRAHFPELCQSETDISFGIALYIPVTGWNADMFSRLERIIDEETEVMSKNKAGRVEYCVVDLGKRVRFSGYFLSRIINEVFVGKENEFSCELFSEGKLPYRQA